MKQEFYVGQEVRIRDWDDMAQEFRIENGDIMCTAVFVPMMSFLCGKVFIIEKINKDIVLLKDAPHVFTYSVDMIEPAENSFNEPFDEIAFERMLDDEL